MQIFIRFSNSNPYIDHTNKPKFYRIEMQSMTRQSVTGPEKINYLSEKECSESYRRPQDNIDYSFLSKVMRTHRGCESF